MAQDFYAVFGIGQDNLTIAQTDEAGVAFAAIKGLHRLVHEKDAKIDAQQHEIAELRTELDAVKRAVAQLMSANARVATRSTP